MKYKWLNQKQNTEIIVFFNGWGMDEGVVKHLDSQDYDVLMFYDYNFLNTDFNFEILKKYAKRYLIAWSMGVMTAAVFNNILYESKTAINGTLKPVDNNFGIPERIYDLTIKGFNEKGRERFIRNMFDRDVELPAVKRDLENQKHELSALKTYRPEADFKYDKIYISNNDKIIPSKNQSAFWGIEPNLNSGHCPFFMFKNWKELL